MNLENDQLIQGDAFKWLLEMELVSDPNVINGIILNVYKISKSIKDVEIVFDTNEKKMLVYIKLSWFGNRFLKEILTQRVSNLVADALPAYTHRVVHEYTIFAKALEILNGKK